MGDYVLSGGELPALVVIDALARLMGDGALERRTFRVSRRVLRMVFWTGRITPGPRTSRGSRCRRCWRAATTSASGAGGCAGGPGQDVAATPGSAPFRWIAGQSGETPQKRLSC